MTKVVSAASPRRRLELQLQESLRAALDDFRDIDVDELEEALTNGSYAEVERIVGLDDSHRDRLFLLFALAIRSAVEASMNAEAERLGIEPNPLSPAVNAWINNRASLAAGSVIDQARNVMIGTLSRTTRQGLTPDEIARIIALESWLPDRHAAAMDAQRARMTEAGVPVRQREAKEKRTALTYLAIWVSLMSITEVSAAISFGRSVEWKDALRQGLIPYGFQVVWVTARDERVCDRCGPLDGLVQEYGNAWGAEAVIEPPLHPRCRCELELA